MRVTSQKLHETVEQTLHRDHTLLVILSCSYGMMRLPVQELHQAVEQSLHSNHTLLIIACDALRSHPHVLGTPAGSYISPWDPCLLMLRQKDTERNISTPL